MTKYRIISIIMIICIIVGNIPVNIKADEPSVYKSDRMQDLVDTYLYYEDFFDILTTDEGIAYWSSVNKLKQDRDAAWLFDKGSAILHEKYSKEDYAELLTYIMSSNEAYLAEMIENMPSFDKTYNLNSFNKDMISIAGDFINVAVGDSFWDIVFGTSVDFAGDLPELAEDIEGDTRYYNIIVQDYVSNAIFLQTIYDKTENDELKEACKEMLEASSEISKQKIKYYFEVFNTSNSFNAKIYCKNLLSPVLKKIAEKTDKKLVSKVAAWAGKAFQVLFAEGKLTFDLIMTFVGDLTFATSDCFHRENELIALAEIARCISEGCNNITVNNTLNRDTFKSIQEKLYYYDMLITIHYRGEYNTYKMITNRMNVLVVFEEVKTDLKNFLKSVFQGTPYKEERPNDEWFQTQLTTLSNMESQLRTLKENAQFISHNAYVTGKVLCGDTGEGAVNALLVFQSEEDGTFLFSREDGTINDYVRPGTYSLTVIYKDYEELVQNIEITEEGADIGKILLTKEGMPVVTSDEDIQEKFEEYISNKEILYGKSCTFTLTRGGNDNNTFEKKWENLSEGVILGYSIEDFDNDERSELFLITLVDDYRLQLEMYEVVNDKVILVDRNYPDTNSSYGAVRFPCGRDSAYGLCGILSCFVDDINHKIYLQSSDAVHSLGEGEETFIASLSYKNNSFTDFSISHEIGSSVEDGISDRVQELVSMGVPNIDYDVYDRIFYSLAPLSECFGGGVHEVLHAEQYTVDVEKEDSATKKIVTKTFFATKDGKIEKPEDISEPESDKKEFSYETYNVFFERDYYSVTENIPNEWALFDLDSDGIPEILFKENMYHQYHQSGTFEVCFYNEENGSIESAGTFSIDNQDPRWSILYSAEKKLIIADHTIPHYELLEGYFYHNRSIEWLYSMSIDKFDFDDGTWSLEFEDANGKHEIRDFDSESCLQTQEEYFGNPVKIEFQFFPTGYLWNLPNGPTEPAE